MEKASNLGQYAAKRHKHMVNTLNLLDTQLIQHSSVS